MTTLANWITLSRLFLIPVFITTLYLPIKYNDWIAAGVFCLISLTDALDGWVARARKEKTEIGAALDPLVDKILIAAALIFLIRKGVEPWMAFVIIAREFLVTGMRVIVKSKKILSAQLSGKIKTAVQMIAIVAVLLNAPFAWHLMLLATIITVVSGIDYIWKVRKEIKW